ncbi:MAG: response regulator [Sandaracinaceae bacterium]|nr:response regulator [Sandaracinaceae bacterium]
MGETGGSLRAEEVQTAIDALREGIQLLSPEWRYLYVNAAGARPGRKPREELLGRTMLECYPGIEHTAVFAVLRRCMSSRRGESLDSEFVYADGARAWFELRIEPCPEGIIVLSLDVTARKEMEAALRRSHKLRALGQMAGSVAHDLKNLLNPIALDVQRLRRLTAQDERAQSILGQIDDAIRTGADTVERLRAFSRQDAERAAEPTDPSRMAEVALRICAPRIDAQAGIELRRELAAVPLVLVRPSELVNAVVNLVVNALDAMPGGGTITVRTGDGDGVWVEVEDDGPGMPPEVERRLFEPFFTTKAHGTGLGLSMIYALAQRAGGRVSVQAAPGRGTRVRLWFPGVERKLAEGERSAQPPRRLLGVEDDAGARDALRLLLSEEGFMVEASASAEEALARLTELDPDLLLVDLCLPGMSGVALARRARELLGGLPVLVMSGLDEHDRAVAGWLCEPKVGHVTKPIQLDRLIGALDRLLAEEPLRAGPRASPS